MLFKDSEAEKFAEELAVELARRFPPRTMSAEGKRPRETVVARAMEHVSLSARSFRPARKVGILKQLGVSKAFQSKLDSLGYDEEFIKAATLRLIQVLGTKRTL
jgi:hypothetical protein